MYIRAHNMYAVQAWLLTIKRAYGNMQVVMVQNKNKKNNTMTRLTPLLAASVVVVSSIMMPTIVRADQFQSQIDALELQKNSNAQNSQGLAATASTIQGEINALAQQIASIQSQIDTNTSRQQDLTNQIDAAQKRVEEQKGLLSANIRSMYIEGDISPLEMIASSKNLGDFVDKQEYRDRIKDSISSTMDEIERLKKQLDGQKKEITKIINEQKSLRGTLTIKNQEAGTKLASVNQDKAGFDAQINAESKEITKLQKEVQQMQAELARVNSTTIKTKPSQGSLSQGQMIGTVGSTGNSTGAHLHLRAQRNGRAVNPAQFLGNRWANPVSGPITQNFGENPYRYGYGAAGHDGMDFGVSAGTPIRAVEPGTVYKGWSRSFFSGDYFGCMAMVEHSDGLISIYAHMQAQNCD